MKRMIKYPSIGQFRNIVKNVVEHSCFIGLDSEGVAIEELTDVVILHTEPDMY